MYFFLAPPPDVDSLIEILEEYAGDEPQGRIPWEYRLRYVKDRVLLEEAETQREVNGGRYVNVVVVPQLQDWIEPREEDDIISLYLLWRDAESMNRNRW